MAQTLQPANPSRERSTGWPARMRHQPADRAPDLEAPRPPPLLALSPAVRGRWSSCLPSSWPAHRPIADQHLGDSLQSRPAGSTRGSAGRIRARGRPLAGWIHPSRQPTTISLLLFVVRRSARSAAGPTNPPGSRPHTSPRQARKQECWLALRRERSPSEACESTLDRNKGFLSVNQLEAFAGRRPLAGGRWPVAARRLQTNRPGRAGESSLVWKEFHLATKGN